MDLTVQKGQVLRKHREFAILTTDISGVQVFAHRSDYADAGIDFAEVKIGQRMSYRILPSEKYPGKLCVFGIRRE